MGSDKAVPASSPALGTVPAKFYRGPPVQSDASAALAPPLVPPSTPSASAPLRGSVPPSVAAPRAPAAAVVIALGLPPPEAPSAVTEEEDDGLASQLGGPGRKLAPPELDACAPRRSGLAVPDAVAEEAGAGAELPEGDDPELLELVAALGGGAATDTELRAALKRVVAGGTPLASARTPAEAAAAAFAWTDGADRAAAATEAAPPPFRDEPRDTDMRDASDDGGGAEWGEREEPADEYEEVVPPKAAAKVEDKAVPLPAPAPVVTDNYDVGSDGEREPGEEAAEAVVAAEPLGGVPALTPTAEAVQGRPAIFFTELPPKEEDEEVVQVQEMKPVEPEAELEVKAAPVPGRPAIFVGDAPGEPEVPSAAPVAPPAEDPADAEVALVMQTVDVPIPSPREEAAPAPAPEAEPEGAVDMDADTPLTPMVPGAPPSPPVELPFEYDDLSKPGKAAEEPAAVASDDVARPFGMPKGGFRDVAPSPTASDTGSVTLAALSRVAAAAEAAAAAAAAAAREAADAAAMARAARSAAGVTRSVPSPMMRVAMPPPPTRTVMPPPPPHVVAYYPSVDSSEMGDPMTPGATLAAFTGGERFLAVRLGPRAPPADDEEAEEGGSEKGPKRPGSPKKEGSPKAAPKDKGKGDTADEEPSQTVAMEYSFVALPDGRVLSSGPGKVAHVWDAASGACVLELKGHAGRAWAVAASADGTALYTGGWDGEVRVWDAQRGVCASALKGFHTDRVWALASLPCGMLVSGSWDGTLRVWHSAAPPAPPAAQPAAAPSGASSLTAASGAMVVAAPAPAPLPAAARLAMASRNVLRGHNGRVLSVAPLGDVRCVSGGADATARVWNCLMGTCERVLTGHAGPIGAVAVFPDTEGILTASADGSLRIWAPRALAESHVLVGHAGAVTCCLALPGGVAVSGGADGTVRIWAPTGAAAAVLRGHSAALTALAAVGPGLVASGGADDALCTWDVAAGALVRLQGRRGREPNAPRFAAARAGVLAAQVSGHWAVSVPPGGAMVALRAARGAELDGTLRMRFLTAGQLEEAAEADFEGHSAITAGSPKAAGSPSKKKGDDAEGWEKHHMATASGASAPGSRPARPGSPTAAHPTVAAAAAAAVTAAAGAPPRPGYAHAVHSFLALSDGRVAVTSDSPEVTVWDAAAGVVCSRLSGHAERVWSAVELPSRRLLATASWDTTLRLWDLQADECAAEMKGHTGKVWCLVALDVEGVGSDRLVSGSWDGTLRVWSADAALAGLDACLAVLEGHGCKVWTLAALGDAHCVSGGVDGTLRVWDCAAGVCLHALPGSHTGPVAALAALGGGRIASGGWDGVVRVWDAQRGAPERLLAGHAGKVTALAPLGRGRVASASADGTVRVWDAAGGALLHTLVDHAGWVTHLADLGGGRFASASADNALRIWDADTGRCQLVLSACDDNTVYAVAAPGRAAATPGRYCFTLPVDGQAIAAITQLM